MTCQFTSLLLTVGLLAVALAMPTEQQEPKSGDAAGAELDPDVAHGLFGSLFGLLFNSVGTAATAAVSTVGNVFTALG
ncbi:hypothetical protein pipiens_002751 [Culex pipiens pipiens]|uniref:Secreted protein n=1 Tax=Culex pipiens pipiens TaxID=38569 RepID=A0ABD1D8T2_CULPP